jgi:hypothetical protein
MRFFRLAICLKNSTQILIKSTNYLKSGVHDTFDVDVLSTNYILENLIGKIDFVDFIVVLSSHRIP